MSNNLATRSRWSIDSSVAGNKQLRKVKTYKVTDNGDAEHAFNCSDDAPVGVIDKPGGFEIEFEYYAEQGTPEVNWRKIQVAKEFFALTREYPGGERLQYARCFVANVAGEGDDGGSHMITVKIICNAPVEL